MATANCYPDEKKKEFGMARKKRSQFYAGDRSRMISRCREIRSALNTERSGAVLHDLDIELQFTRDKLAHLRKTG